MLRLIGNRDGSARSRLHRQRGERVSAGDRADGRPVNHVLPAWDIAAGLYLATGLLAAERIARAPARVRRSSPRSPMSCSRRVGNLGYIGDVEINGTVRPAIGNDLYGSFGPRLRDR